MKGFKLAFVFLIFVIFSAALIGRLIDIQIRKGDLYKALSQGLHIIPGSDQAERGEIFFNNQESLAINKNWPLAWALPKEIENFKETAEKLSQILDLSESSILEKLETNKSYVIIKDKLNEKEAELLSASNLDGVYLDIEKGRYYPQESLASQLIGFLGGGDSGQYGLEEHYNETLEGKIESGGTDLILTLDYKIQFMAEQLLAEAKDNLEIESGQIIVIEPNSGKILALANFPNFNPNQYKEFAVMGDLDIFQNSVTQKVFEPGSVLKAITFAVALNEGKITPETTYTDTGVVNIGGWPIYNYEERVYGETPMTEVLEKSINTGAVFAQKQIGNELFLQYLDRFGFFEQTGIDLREVYSENEELKKGYEVNFATASFGQGIEMTPIQLVRAYCVLANGGKLIQPYLVDEVWQNGKMVEKKETEITSDSIISQKAARQLTAMLVNVIEKGFARQAQIPGYYIAGKTGTALIPYEEKKGYSEETRQSFIGWFPAFDPKALILVKLDKPETKTAEYLALPVFKKMAEYIVNYQQIPPDYE